MYIQVENEKLIAYAGYSFMGYTDEVKEVEYEDYQANPNKYMLAVESEEEIEVIDYKTIIVEEQIPICYENEEITSYEIVEVEKQVEDGSHTEIKIHYTLVLNPDFEKEQEQKRKEEFENAFFHTSLGWIRRSVSMKDGSTKSFLTDLLPQLTAGIPVLAYALPDFTQEISIVDYQQKVIVTEQFIQECKNQLYADFYGTKPE